MKKTMKTLLAAVAVATTAMSATADDRFYIENFDIAPGETKTVSIMLDNAGDYVAFQSDVYLPEGLTADNWTLTERKEDHSFSKSNPATGVTRIVAITLTNSSIKGNTGALVTFDVTAAEDLTVGTTLDGRVASSQFSYINGTYETLAEEAYTVTVVEATEEPVVDPNRLYIEDFEIEANVDVDNSKEVSVNFCSEYQIKGVSGELLLTDGLMVDEWLVINSSMYRPTSSITVDGNIATFSISSTRALSVYEGNLFTLYFYTSENFAGTHTIELRNLKFTDSAGEVHELSNNTTTVTGPAVESNEVELTMQNSYYNNVIFFLPTGTVQKIKIVDTDARFVLNTVMFNDENVTEQLVDGVYTTPALEEDAVINISYDIPTAQNAPMHNSRIKAYGHRGDVVVAGCERGESIAIYDVDGVLLRTIYATSDTMRIAMPTDAVYVVKVADAAVKVAL